MSAQTVAIIRHSSGSCGNGETVICMGKKLYTYYDVDPVSIRRISRFIKHKMHTKLFQYLAVFSRKDLA